MKYPRLFDKYHKWIKINCHIEWNFRPAECFSLTQTPQKTQNCALADYAKASYSLGNLKGSVVATDANAPRQRACLRDVARRMAHTSVSDVCLCDSLRCLRER